MTSNVTMGSGTAVFYARAGGVRLAVVDCHRQTVELVGKAHGMKVREEIPLSDFIEAVDPDGTTWTRRGISI